MISINLYIDIFRFSYEFLINVEQEYTFNKTLFRIWLDFFDVCSFGVDFYRKYNKKNNILGKKIYYRVVFGKFYNDN